MEKHTVTSVFQTGKTTDWKSYLEASSGPGDLLNRKYWSQLLWDNNRLPNQLLLSSELGWFELQIIEIREFPSKSLIDFLYENSRKL